MLNPTPQEVYENNIKKWIPKYLGKIENDPSDSLSMSFLSTLYRELAVLEWYLHKDVEKFKEYMKISVDYDQKRFEDILTRTPKRETNAMWITPMLCAMSSADVKMMQQPYIEFVDDHFEQKPGHAHKDNSLYTCLVILATGRHQDLWESSLAHLKKSYDCKKWIKLYPIALMLEAIWNKDAKVFNEQAQVFANSYKSMTLGIFSDYEDELLSLWGLGICNLAVMKGMKVTIDHLYVPKELIG